MARHILSVKFGLRVLELRKAAGFSQESFSLHSGIARSYMSRMERGKAEPKFEVLAKLSIGLGVPVSALFEEPKGVAAAVKKPKKTPLLVPFSKDGECFNPGLRQGVTGEFAVGSKSARKKFKTFSDALDYLKDMKPKAEWLRPSKNGNPGVVTAVAWKPLPAEFLHLLTD